MGLFRHGLAWGPYLIAQVSTFLHNDLSHCGSSLPCSACAEQGRDDPMQIGALKKGPVEAEACSENQLIQEGQEINF